MDIPEYITAQADTYSHIKNQQRLLKNNQTRAEKILWQELRNKKIGHKIRRQHIINKYIVDFVCLEKRLIIEIDGEIHNSQKEHDDERSRHIESLEYRVIRFTNGHIFNNLFEVVQKIKDALES